MPLNKIVYAPKSLIMRHKERPYSSYGTFITVLRPTVTALVRAARCALNFRNRPFSGVGNGGEGLGGGGCGGWSPPKTLGTGTAPPWINGQSVFPWIVATTAVREYALPYACIRGPPHLSAWGGTWLNKSARSLAPSPYLWLRETMRLARAVSARVCVLLSCTLSSEVSKLLQNAPANPEF